jgi:hypothetical protein
MIKLSDLLNEVKFDSNGQMKIKKQYNNVYDFEKNAKNGDYVWVEFRLPYETPFKDRNLYLIGSFSDWQLKDEFKLQFKHASKYYAARILLKQGIYNYLYALEDPKTGLGDCKLMEGSHFMAENDYTVLMYHRAYTNDFDELVGYQRINTAGN